MFASNVFDYINVLDRSADASWQRQELIANNIANQDTPNFKRQDIDFEGQLERAMKRSKYVSVDAKVSNLEMSRLKPRTYTDYRNFSYRLDGNNVDPEQEQVRLAANQVKYQGLINSMTQEFNNLRSVMK